MSPTPEPRPGLYLDSSGSRYIARLDNKSGWWIQKQVPPGMWPHKPFQKPDFAAACHAGIFTFQPDTI